MSAMAEKFRVRRGVELALLLAFAACSSNSEPSEQSMMAPASSQTASMATTQQASGAGRAAQTGSAGKPSSAPNTQAQQSPASSAAAGSSKGASGAAAASTQTMTAAAGASGMSGASASPAAGSGSAGMNASAAGGGAGGGAIEKPCPATNTLKTGNNAKMLNHGGRDRRFSVYVPSSVTAMMRAPLVLDFHGNGSNGAQEQSGSGWQQKADAEHFIVAYPDGVGNGWNVGNCCGDALNMKVDDVGFARAIVENISSEACVDAHRVYATGISNGAGLAHRLACEAADVFAAIAAASADLVTDPCKPARPISEISVRGLSDTLVAYEGGNTGSTGWYSPGAKGTLELWKNIDGCMGSTSMSQQYCETYNQCMAGVEVTLCSLPGTGHILYTNSLGFSVPDTAWEMFKRQTLP